MQKWTNGDGIAEQLMDRFEASVHAVLHKYHLSTNDPEYQDLLQQGRIVILEAYEQLKGDPFGDPATAYIYVSYIQRGTHWKCLKYFTKANMIHRHEVGEEALLTLEGVEEKGYRRIEEYDQYRLAYQALTKRQQKTVQLLLQVSERIPELAKLEHRCVSKYYRDLSNIRKKYQSITQEQRRNTHDQQTVSSPA